MENKVSRPIWRRNLYVLWGCTFVAGIAFSEVGPFLSLFISQIGDFSHQELNFYSGIIYAVSFLVTAFMAPLWGKLAGSRGHRIILFVTAGGMAIIYILTGFVHNVVLLFLARAAIGAFSGYIPNAQALVAAQVPRDKSGRLLGTLMTGSTSGVLVGPVLGGVLSHIFSIRQTFFITGGLLLIVAFLSVSLVKEHVPDGKTVATHTKRKGGLLKQFSNPRLIMVLLISTLIVQLGNSSIFPIISLYVRQLMHGHGAITVIAGVISALPGISNIMAAPRLGQYGDHHGSGKVLIAGYLFAILVYLPQGFFASLWILGILRFLVGISDAALFPTIQTLLTKNSPPEALSDIFAWNQSFQALGSMFGALWGGAVAGMFGYNMVFMSTAVLLLINFVLLWFTEPSLRGSKAV
ncbi:MFS transporter [uncultured Lacticaseibacillus sp.]|uniref:MFS transporter n=1 Tax=uncultured Lacticaseibacillus sp. TaxID=2775882 RepID=UPI002591CA43|nr:MFS transporter [uncultured Lacticaseibacillus sp.]